MWMNNFGGLLTEGFNSVVQCEDGNLVAVGYSFSTGPTASIAVSYDKNGKLILSPAIASTSAAPPTSSSPAGASSVINAAHNISTVTVNGVPTSVDTYSIN